MTKAKDDEYVAELDLSGKKFRLRMAEENDEDIFIVEDIPRKLNAQEAAHIGMWLLLISSELTKEQLAEWYAEGKKAQRQAEIDARRSQS